LASIGVWQLWSHGVAKVWTKYISGVAILYCGSIADDRALITSTWLSPASKHSERIHGELRALAGVSWRSVWSGMVLMIGLAFIPRLPSKAFLRLSDGDPA